MSATVQQIESGTDGIANTGASSGIQRQIPPESLDLVDWNRAYSVLLQYKETKGFSNPAGPAWTAASHTGSGEEGVRAGSR